MSIASTLFLALVAVSTSTASPAEGARDTDGPILELDGLDLDEDVTPATVSPVETATSNAAFVDSFVSLTDRVARLVDRTTLGGYGEHEFEAGDGKISRFRNHRFILFVYSQISERISTSTEIEFEFAGSPKKTDGALGFGEVLLEFSVVDLMLADWLVLRAGVILMPVSVFNLRHDAPTRDLTNRPIAYTSIVPSTWFESGAGFLGNIPIGDTQRLSYELYLVNGLDARIQDGFGFRAARGSHFEDNNHDKALTGRLSYSPWLGFEVGVSGYTGVYDKLGNRANLLNLDFMLRLGRVELLGEGVVARLDEGYVEGFPAGSTANTRDPVPTSMAGFYLQGNYHLRIPPIWELFPDWLATSTLTGAIRYEGKDTDTTRGSRAGDQRRLTFALNFRPVEQYVFKTEYAFDSFGIDEERGAPEVWSSDFWSEPVFTFLSSAAYLF